MQYGVNSNIQTQFITSADGSALSAVCFSIPLKATQLFISSTTATYMGLFDGDVDIPTKRFPPPFNIRRYRHRRPVSYSRSIGYKRTTMVCCSRCWTTRFNNFAHGNVKPDYVKIWTIQENSNPIMWSENMAKFSYLWKTTDTGKEMWLPLKKGRTFEKRGMLSFSGKFKLGMLPSGKTGLVKVRRKK